jgi:RNA polymerase sigma factor (sigma-70 family)
MEAAGSPAPLAVGGAYPRSRRLLKLAPDELLVGRVRSGSEQAFAILYERHYRNILAFCRYMLGTRDEAEDAAQQTLVNAYRDMLRGDKELKFRPWLYRIARNHCISVLRARRTGPELSEQEPSPVALSEELGTRQDLRDLLRDLAALPDDQREALVLAELHDNSHAEVAEIIGCDREKVKSLVFQARSSLFKGREAREVPCEEIRRQLSVLRGGALRRSLISRHLQDCEGCRAFSSEVKRQRQALALLLPVVPASTLKLGAANAIAAVGIKAASAAGAGATAAGGSAAVGAAAAQGSAGGALSAPFAALAGKLGVSTLAVKGAAATVAVTVAAGGGAVAVKEIREPAPTERAPAAERTLGDERPGSRGPDGPAGAAGIGSGTLLEQRHRRGAQDRRVERSSRSRRLAQRALERKRGSRRRAGEPQRGARDERRVVGERDRIRRKRRRAERELPERSRSRRDRSRRHSRQQRRKPARRRSARKPLRRAPVAPILVPAQPEQPIDPLAERGTTGPSSSR